MKKVKIFVEGVCYEALCSCVSSYVLARYISENTLVRITDTEYERFEFSPLYDVFRVCCSYDDNIFVLVNGDDEFIVYEGDSYNAIEFLNVHKLIQ